MMNYKKIQILESECLIAQLEAQVKMHKAKLALLSATDEETASIKVTAPKETEPKEEAVKVEEKPKRQSRKKAVEEPKVEEVEATDEIIMSEMNLDDDLLSDDLEEKTEAPKVSQITEMQVREELVKYAKKSSKESAYAVLAKFGAQKVADLSPSDFPKVFSILQKGQA